jgi:glutaminyl-tRNA synthetase
MNEPKGKAEGQENAPNFVHDLVREDLRTGKHDGMVVTRFPPEPNGYLHIGHAKSICLNFTTAALAEGGRCHLRFDDTNPEAEDTEYVEAIRDDVRWLGFDWGSHEYFASDYFERLYECANSLIERGLAYVDSQSLEEIRQGRGDFYRPGVNSPFRERSVEENLDLFARMRAGEFDEGAHVLRAKIDMAATR